MLEQLTPDQEKRLIEFRAEWLEIGLSCQAADFETGDAVIRGFYRRLGKPEPLILHFSSPAMCELAVNVIFKALGEDNGDQIFSPFRRQLHTQLHEQLGSRIRRMFISHLGKRVQDQLGAELSRKLSNPLNRELGAKLDDHIYRQLQDRSANGLFSRLGESLFSQLLCQLRGSLDNQLFRKFGDHIESFRPHFLSNRLGAPCAWEAYYLFGHEIGVRYHREDLALLQEWGLLARSIGWWAAWDDLCIVSDRPRLVKLDDDNRLHSQTGPAVEYSDGWRLHAWHGVRIPGEWIDQPETLTAEMALACANAEQRRVAIELLGWSRILDALEARTVDQDGDPEIGTLVEVRLPDLPLPARFLRVRCGTGRDFSLGVHPTCKTALEAQAWMLGLTVKDFIKPEVRT